MVCVYVAGICSNIAPARRQGYGPFDRTDQVAPDDEMEEDDKMEQALPGNQPSGAGEMPANDAGHTSPQAVVSDASPRHPAIQSDVDESNPSPRRSSMSLHSRNSSLSIDSGSLSYGTGRDLWGPGGKLHEDTRLILHLMRRVEGLSLIKRETGGVSRDRGLNNERMAVIYEWARQRFDHTKHALAQI